MWVVGRSTGMEVVASDDPMIDVETIAAELGPEVTVRSADTGSTDAIVAAAADADALVVDVNSPVTADVLAACEQLRIVARAGVGVDNVDVRAAADNDVVVTNAPGYCTDEVASHSVALLLACTRKLTHYDRDVRDGGWDWAVGGDAHRLPGSTLGFVSYGPIARRVRERIAGFDLEFVAYDPYVDADEMAADGVEKVDYDELLDRSELLSVNAPLTEETHHMVDADALARLPDHAVLVNTGRGGLIDEAALAEALDAGELGAAGLDVFEREPPEDTPLLDCENAILSPHAGWYSVEARRELNETVGANVGAALAGETPPDRIDPDLDWV